MNGLYDDQSYFLLDGVPLDLAGYPFGIDTVPVDIIDRVEVYRGVVPLRFGADVVGGAVSLVTDRAHETGGSVSYELGSFGTHRVTLSARYRHPSGFVAGGTGFFDVAENDYNVDVEVADASGRTQAVNVPRFHDAYVAYGGSVEVGVVDRPWARRLLLRGFVATYDKELQHNSSMTVPYGEVTYGESVAGANVRYEQALLPQLEIDVLGSYNHRTLDFFDKGEWAYDWSGTRLGKRQIPGEIGGGPIDRTVSEHSALGRGTLAWNIAPQHALRLSLSPRFMTRAGEDRLGAPAARDPFTARQEIFTLVSGLEHELDALSTTPAPVDPSERRSAGYLLQNTLFIKDHIYHASGEEPVAGGNSEPSSLDTHGVGVGDILQVRCLPWLFVKASYEYATTEPRPDDVFGDGRFISPNFQLDPETSHNANIGPRIELRRSALGDLTVNVNSFWRESEGFILLVESDPGRFTYQNGSSARALGIEGSFAWSLPGRWLTLDGSATYQDVRLHADEGALGQFNGERIPNQPWLFASWGARLRFARLLSAGDELEPFYVGGYVHEFLFSWEGLGDPAFQRAHSELILHGAGVTYSLRTDVATFSSTIEARNLTDEKAYDVVGVQRPGRVFSLKLTAEL